MVGGAEIIFRHSRYVQAARAHDIISHWDLSRAIRSKFHCLVKFCRLISLRGPAGRNSQGGDVEARERRASRRKSVGIVRWKLVNTVSPRKLCLLFLSCRSAGYHRVAPFCRVKMVFLVFPLLSGLYLHSSHFSKVIRGAKSDQRVFEKKKRKKEGKRSSTTRWFPLFSFFLSFERTFYRLGTFVEKFKTMKLELQFFNSFNLFAIEQIFAFRKRIFVRVIGITICISSRFTFQFSSFLVESLAELLKNVSSLIC